MKTNLLFIVAIIAIIITFVNFSVSFARLASLRNILTGLSLTPQGFVNLTVSTEANINFSTNTINFGPGVHLPGDGNNASLQTPFGNLRGNWTNVTNGLQLDNIGNINVSINLTAGKTASDFLGAGENLYNWNMTEVDIGACQPANASMLKFFINATTTSSKFCNNLSNVPTANSVRIDVLLHVPRDGAKGDLADIITATAVTPS